MFIAYVKQTGEGCDYTIDCGKTLWKLEARTRSEALEELKRKVIGKWLPEYKEYEGGCWGDSELACLTLFEIVDEEEIPLKQWYSDAKDFKEKAD